MTTPVKVKGFEYAPSHWPWNLLWLADRVFADDVEPTSQVGLWDIEPQGEPDRCEVVLVREPDNRVDPNAIKVLIPALADGGYHPFVGYVEAPLAAVYAPRLDAGWPCEAWVKSIPVRSPEEINRPGLRVYVEWGPEPSTKET